jgi:hypothetical protein
MMKGAQIILARISGICSFGEMSSMKLENSSARQFFFNPWFVLPALSLLICLARLVTFYEPTDRDLAAYAVIANEVLHGERLYDGVLMDQKPPAIHFTYGLAEVIAGYGRFQIYLLGVGAAITTLFGAYFAGKTISKSAGLWVALFWTVICSHLALEANQPNSEVFINAWMIFGLAFLLQKRGSSWRLGYVVAAGVCFAAASLYKHSVVIIHFFVSIAYIACPSTGRGRWESFLNISIIGSIGLAAWGILVLYFDLTGRYQNLIDSLFVYNLYYAGDISSNVFAVMQFFRPALVGMSPLFILIAVGLVVGIRQRDYPGMFFLLSLAVGTEISVQIPGRFYPHYYQLWFPFLLIGSAFALKWIGTEKSLLPGLKNAIGTTVVVVLLVIEVPSFFLTAREWSAAKYGQIFLVTNDLAKELKGLQPGECFCQIGSQTQLYFDTGQRPIGPLADFGVFAGPLAGDLSKKMMSALQKRKPDLIILDKHAINQIPSSVPLISWMDQNYDRAPGIYNREPLFLFVKKESALESRLKALDGRNRN